MSYSRDYKSIFIHAISSLRRDEGSEGELTNVYLNLISLRHDTIHAYVCKALNVPFNPGTTKKFTDYFDQDEVIGKTTLTPDIVIIIKKNDKKTKKIQKKAIVIDVSVAKDHIANIDKKIQKYSILKECVTIPLEIFVFSVQPDYRNLYVMFDKLCKEMEIGEPFDFGECLQILEFNDVCRKEIRDKLENSNVFNRTVELEYGQAETFTPEFDTLLDLSSKISSLNEDFKRQIDDKTIESLAHELKPLLKDKDVIGLYQDKEIKPESFANGFKHIRNEIEKTPKMAPKPTLHMFFPRLKLELFSDPISGMLPEQNQIIGLMRYMTSNTVLEKMPFISQLSKLTIDTIMLEDIKDIDDTKKYNKQMFNTGDYVPSDQAILLKKEYHEYRDSYKDTNVASAPFLKYCQRYKHWDFDDESPHFIKQKIIKIPDRFFSKESMEFINKANNQVAKKGNVRIDRSTKTVELKEAKAIEAFLDELQTDTMAEEVIHADKIMHQPPGKDGSNIQALKLLMHERFTDCLTSIETTYVHTFAQRYSRVAEQLLHFSNFSLPKGTYSLFTADVPNTVFVVANSYHDTGKDVGKSFMSFGLIAKTEKVSNVFGEVKIIETESLRHNIFYTNWRRLTMDRLHFIREAYFQTLSTGIGSMLRRKENHTDEQYRKDIRHNYCIRVLIGMSTKQKMSEMLADFRYLIMHSISEFGSVEEFIRDKLSPPYRTSIEAWIASRIVRCGQINQLFKSGKLVTFRQPTFYITKRSNESLGGDLRIPSPWSNFTLYDIQDFLDDLFLYVHTPKEPSSIHHENIKSVETILKFQGMYDKMAYNEREGNWKGIKDYLLNSKLTGHMATVTKLAGKILVNQISSDKIMKNIHKNINESLSEITSTKSVIPEYQREVFEKKMTTKAKNKIEHLKELVKNTDLIPGDSEIRLPNYVNFKKDTNLVKVSTSRVKVHDSVLDMMKRFPEINKTIDLALWNIVENNSRVVSDICIKAQYGGKREFYVINMGAKAMVRIFETTFKTICGFVKSEMISVPGDKKMNIMQDVTNSLIRQKKKGQTIYYVNGDCTKWSAAETMECFRSFLYGFEKFFPPELFEFLMHVLKSWQSKEIQIPGSILSSTLYTSEDSKAFYLKDLNACIKSTQNFLQGMFNYFSSLKAVAASETTELLWRKIHPDSQLIFKHMEHSDDYCLMIACDTVEEFKEFRLLHKVVQKCCGMNDSVKKTNTQKFLMEFISLVSFNGQLTYPHIKKVKETGMNTACTGFRDDVDMACSRIGECVRVGVPLETAYSMGRVHFSNIYRAYSLYKHIDLDRVFNTPVELMGLPDLHPMLYFLTKGNPNNYRLYHYDYEDYDPLKKNRRAIEQLYMAEVFTKDVDETEVNHTELRFYFPKFRYNQEGKLIQEVRKWSKWSFSESQEFFDKNVEYNLVKPKNGIKLVPWLKSMYFKKNFSIAYSRMSRVQLHMRLSRFTSKNILMPFWEDYSIKDGQTFEDYQKSARYYTIEEYLNLIEEKLGSIEYTDQDLRDNFFDKSLKCGDNAVEVFYDTLKYAAIERSHEHKLANTVDDSPIKRTWLSIENSIPTLIQYIFSPDNFALDNRPFKSIASLERDRLTLEKNYGDINNINPMLIRNIYNDLMNNSTKALTCMTYGKSNRRIEDYIKNQIEYGTNYRFKYTIKIKQTYSVTDMLTGELITRKLLNVNKDMALSVLDIISMLLALLMYKAEHDVYFSIDYIKKLIVNDEFGKPLKTVEAMLKSLTYEGIKSYMAPVRTLKQFCMFSFLMFEDRLPLQRFVDENTTYTFKYLENDVPSQKEKVYFEYQSQSYIAYVNKDSEVTLISPKKSYDLVSSAYIIAQRLFGQISDLELDLKLGLFDIRTSNEFKIDMNIFKTKIFDVHEGHINPEKLVLATRHRLEYQKIKIENPGELSFKGVLYFPTLPEYYARNTKNLVIIPEVNASTLSVTFNNLKLFTLPVLGGKQNMVLSRPNDLQKLSIGGVYVDFFLENKMLEKYIHHPEKFFGIQPEKHLSITPEKMEELVVTETKKLFGTCHPHDYIAFSDYDSDREVNRHAMMKLFDARMERCRNRQEVMVESEMNLLLKLKLMKFYNVQDKEYEQDLSRQYTEKTGVALEEFPIDEPDNPEPSFDFDNFMSEQGVGNLDQITVPQMDEEISVTSEKKEESFNFDDFMASEGVDAPTKTTLGDHNLSPIDNDQRSDEDVSNHEEEPFNFDDFAMETGLDPPRQIGILPEEEEPDGQSEEEPFDFDNFDLEMDMGDMNVQIDYNPEKSDDKISEGLTPHVTTDITDEPRAEVKIAEMMNQDRQDESDRKDALEMMFEPEDKVQDIFSELDNMGLGSMKVEIMPLEEFGEEVGDMGIEYLSNLEQPMRHGDMDMDMFKDMQALYINHNTGDFKGGTYSAKVLNNLKPPDILYLENFVQHQNNIYKPSPAEFLMMFSMLSRHLERNLIQDNLNNLLLVKWLNLICPQVKDERVQIRSGFFFKREMGKFRVYNGMKTRSKNYLNALYDDMVVTDFDDRTGVYEYYSVLDYEQERELLRRLKDEIIEESYGGENIITMTRTLLNMKPVDVELDEYDDIILRKKSRRNQRNRLLFNF